MSEIPSLDMELITNQLNLNHFIERQNWNLESGIELNYQNNYSNPETKARRLIPNYDKYSGGIYAVLKYKLSPTWNTEAGIRYDYKRFLVSKWYDKSAWEERYADLYPEFYVRTNANRIYTQPDLIFQNISGNVGFQYKPTENFSAKINYARVARTPNIAELFSDGLHHSAGMIEVGDMSLKNEEGNQINLLVDGKLNVLEGLSISVNPYYFITKNFISEIPTGIQNTIRGVFPVYTYQQIDAKMYGIDVDAHWKLTENFQYRGSFSYVYGQDETNDVPLILMMPKNLYNSLQYSNKNWKDFYISIDHRTVFHQNRFPVYNPTIKIYENGIEAEKILDLSTPPPTYSLFGASVGAHIYKNLSVGLQVRNILNTAYTDYLNRMRFFAHEMGRNFILNLKFNF